MRIHTTLPVAPLATILLLMAACGRAEESAKDKPLAGHRDSAKIDHSQDIVAPESVHVFMVTPAPGAIPVPVDSAALLRYIDFVVANPDSARKLARLVQAPTNPGVPTPGLVPGATPAPTPAQPAADSGAATPAAPAAYTAPAPGTVLTLAQARDAIQHEQFVELHTERSPRSSIRDNVRCGPAGIDEDGRLTASLEGVTLLINGSDAWLDGYTGDGTVQDDGSINWGDHSWKLTFRLRSSASQVRTRCQ